MSSVEIPPQPLMDIDQIQYLQNKLANSKCFLEYGAGGSTRLAAKMGIDKIFSVESDIEYSREVIRSALADRPGLNLTMNTPDIGNTGAWGFPVNRDKFHLWPRYALDVWDDIRKTDHAPDLVLIDGRFRVACFVACMMFCNEKVEILVDDYIGRTKKYRMVEILCKPTLIVGRMAVCHVPSVRSYPELSAALEKFSHIPD